VVTTVVMVVRISEGGASGSFVFELGGGVTDGDGVWDGVVVGDGGVVVLGVVVGGGGGDVVVAGGGGGVVGVAVGDVVAGVVALLSPVFCRGLMAKPLSAASLASMTVASVRATADSPMAKSFRKCMLEKKGSARIGWSKGGEYRLEAKRCWRCPLGAAKDDKKLRRSSSGRRSEMD